MTTKKQHVNDNAKHKGFTIQKITPKNANRNQIVHILLPLFDLKVYALLTIVYALLYFLPPKNRKLYSTL